MAETYENAIAAVFLVGDVQRYVCLADHPTVRWYRDRAEWFGQRVMVRMENYLGILDDDDTVQLARVAGHFGALVLGYEENAGKQIIVAPSPEQLQGAQQDHRR